MVARTPVKTDYADGPGPNGIVNAAAMNAMGQRLNALASPQAVVVASADGANKSVVANYYCTGSNDHEVINAAIASLPPAGGKVVLLEGFYACPGEILIDRDNVTLEGQGGYSTVIGIPLNTEIDRRAAIICGVTRKAQHCTFRDFSINVADYGAEIPEVTTPGTGHGLVITGGKYRIERVNVQFVSGDPFHYGQDLLEPVDFTTVSALGDGYTFRLVEYPETDTIEVVSTEGFNDGGVLWVRKANGRAAFVQYSGKTSTTFTGCAAHWASIGDTLDYGEEKPEDYWTDPFTLATGDIVYQAEYCYDGITYATYAQDFGGCGYFIDFTFSSCEWILARCMGNTWAAGDVGEGDVGHPTEITGQHGFYVQGSVLKFLMCHPYMCNGSGMYIGGRKSYTAENITIDGGEWETCGSDGISVRNNSGHVSITNANFYGNGINWHGSDINAQPGSRNVWVDNCRFFMGPLHGTNLLGKSIWFSGLQHGSVSNCFFDNGNNSEDAGEPSAIDAIYIDGPNGPEAWGRSEWIHIHDNEITRWTDGAFGVILHGSVSDCLIENNVSDAKMIERIDWVDAEPDRNTFRNNHFNFDTGQNPYYALLGEDSRVVDDGIHRDLSVAYGSHLYQNPSQAADQTLYLPVSAEDTLVSRESTDTLKHKSISGADNTLTNLPNSALTYSQMSIGGNTVALGGSVSKDQITGVSTNGLIKRTGANTYAQAVAGTDYAPATGILGTAFAHVASTAIGSTGASDGANTWAKLASFTSATNNWAHDAYFLIITDQFAVNSGASGMLALKLRNVGSASNASLAVTALTDSTPLSPENFRITYGALGDPYELWVKKNLTYGRVILYLLGNAGGGWAITWGSAAAWQSTTPTGSVGQTDSALSVLPPKPRVGTVASSATPAINTNSVDQFNITALAAAITSMTTNLTGTPSDGQTLRIRFKDNGTGRAITWGASFAGNLLTTTVAGMTHVQQLVYDATAAKWIGTYVDTAGY